MSLPHSSSPIEDTDTERSSLSQAQEVLVYEGLPHQSWEPKTLKLEKLRDNTFDLACFTFYTPPTQASQAIINFLSDSNNYNLFRGEKRCEVE